MQISVVIPTRNRKNRLLSLLQSLDRSLQPLEEVIIVDSGDQQLSPADCETFPRLSITCIASESSVCLQRNKGIRAARSPWIFICDDDMEVPEDYLQLLAQFIAAHPGAGAVSGSVLQPEQGAWVGAYPLTSGRELLLKYIFQLGIWGPIDTPSAGGYWTQRIKNYYARKGNHISKAGWPVLTQWDQEVTLAPVYGLGASLIRKEWLLAAPFDEVLDRHGIGDNYGVAMGFPGAGIYIITKACVYHHQEPVNRLQKPLQYYRRALALDYFVRTRARLKTVKRAWMLWSLLGNLLIYMLSRDRLMAGPARKTFWRIARGRNPYVTASLNKQIIAEPLI